MRLLVILFVKRTTPSLRGELTRWMIEPQAGVFVGNVSSLVRDKLWEYVCKEAPEAAAMMIHGAQTEQGFVVRCSGDDTRRPRDFDGLTLVEYARQEVSRT